MADDSFGDRLRRARELRGLTQYRLAECLVRGDSARPHPEHIAKYESDARSPGLDTVTRLAKRLDVSLDWLWNGDGPGPEQTDDNREAS